VSDVYQRGTNEHRRLKEIIGSVVEEKLKEILGDPNEGLEITAAIRERLAQQKKAVASGERGRKDD
jgi:hypothetical protein